MLEELFLIFCHYIGLPEKMTSLKLLFPDGANSYLAKQLISPSRQVANSGKAILTMRQVELTTSPHLLLAVLAH